MVRHIALINAYYSLIDAYRFADINTCHEATLVHSLLYVWHMLSHSCYYQFHLKLILWKFVWEHWTSVLWCLISILNHGNWSSWLEELIFAVGFHGHWQTHAHSTFPYKFSRRWKGGNTLISADVIIRCISTQVLSLWIFKCMHLITCNGSIMPFLCILVDHTITFLLMLE